MFMVEIKNPEVIERRGSKEGREWVMRHQMGYMTAYDDNDKPKPYPIEVKVQLYRDQPSYPVGKYRVPLSCVMPDKYGEVGFRLRILPVQTVPAAIQKAA